MLSLCGKYCEAWSWSEAIVRGGSVGVNRGAFDQIGPRLYVFGVFKWGCDSLICCGIHRFIRGSFMRLWFDVFEKSDIVDTSYPCCQFLSCSIASHLIADIMLMGTHEKSSTHYDQPLLLLHYNAIPLSGYVIWIMASDDRTFTPYINIMWPFYLDAAFMVIGSP